VVAENKNEIVGFCLTAHQGEWGYTITMDVLAPYRRQGVGTMLLTEAERRLVTHGVRQIGLETETGNESAVAFWKKHGYRSFGVSKGYYPGGKDAFSMAKKISS